MTKKQIKVLAKESFVKNNLDEKRVTLIASKLKRQELRSYVRELKMCEKEHTVEVFLASNADETTQKGLELRFPDKQIIMTIDKDLLAGMRIVDNDILYDYTLQDTIGRLVKRIYETND